MDELYHASENQDLVVLEPRGIGKRDPQDEPRVYATDDEAYASMFLVKSDDSWTLKFGLSADNLDAHWFICISDKERYLEKDKGGVIYALPKDQFLPVPNCGTPEWMSTQSVNTVKKKSYTSGIDAMIEHNVQVYFSTKEELEAIREDRNVQKRLQILNQLENENEKRGATNPVKQYLTQMQG